MRDKTHLMLSDASIISITDLPISMSDSVTFLTLRNNLDNKIHSLLFNQFVIVWIIDKLLFI